MTSPTPRRIIALSIAMSVIVATQSMGQAPVGLNRPTTRSSVPSFHLGTALKSAFFSRNNQATASPIYSMPSAYATNLQAVRMDAAPSYPVSQVQYNSPEVLATPIAGPVSGEAHLPATGFAASHYQANVCRCGYCAPPLGASINSYFDAHIYNGEKARLVLYHYDFKSGRSDDQSQLNSAGHRKIARLKEILAWSGHPLVVQHVENDIAMSQARQANVTRVLQTEYELPQTQVVIGNSPLPGIRGPESIDMDRSRQQLTRAMGDSQSGFQSNSTSSASSGQRSRER